MDDENEECVSSNPMIVQMEITVRAIMIINVAFLQKMIQKMMQNKNTIVQRLVHDKKILNISQRISERFKRE
jgi:hypothetical protein